MLYAYGLVRTKNRRPLFIPLFSLSGPPVTRLSLFFRDYTFYVQ